jgi:hypothetical protein
MKIFVPSCSRYSATWQPHLAFMRMFWPDCPWPRVLVTDVLDRPDRAKGFEEVHVVGRDLGWCQNFRDALAKYDDDVLMMTLDDFWCDVPVSTSRIQYAEMYMRNYRNVGCFKVYGSDPATVKIVNNEWGEVPRGSPYRISTCQSLWRKDYIDAILAKFTYPGDWERFGSILSDDMPEKVLGPVEGPGWMSGCYSAIQRQCWTVKPIERARELKIPVELDGRPFGPG